MGDKEEGPVPDTGDRVGSEMAIERPGKNLQGLCRELGAAGLGPEEGARTAAYAVRVEKP